MPSRPMLLLSMGLEAFRPWERNSMVFRTMSETGRWDIDDEDRASFLRGFAVSGM